LQLHAQPSVGPDRLGATARSQIPSRSPLRKAGGGAERRRTGPAIGLIAPAGQGKPARRPDPRGRRRH